MAWGSLPVMKTIARLLLSKHTGFQAIVLSSGQIYSVSFFCRSMQAFEQLLHLWIELKCLILLSDHLSTTASLEWKLPKSLSQKSSELFMLYCRLFSGNKRK